MRNYGFRGSSGEFGLQVNVRVFTADYGQLEAFLVHLTLNSIGSVCALSPCAQRCNVATWEWESDCALEDHRKYLREN